MATLVISSGVSSGGFAIADGQMFNTLIVLSGGNGAPTSVGSGGLVTVSSGGTLVFDPPGSIGANGTVDVLAGGIISNVNDGGTLSGAGTMLGSSNSAGGLMEGLTIGSTAILLMTHNGLASGVMVANGGELIVSGFNDSSSRTLIQGGGLELVSQGIAAGSEIEGGGSQIVSAGGLASATIVSGAGSQTLLGGKSLNTTILNGGVEYVFDSFGEGTFSAVISAGGLIQVASGGAASQSQVAGRLLIHTGSAVSASVLKGGVVQVSSGGLDSATTVRSGGTELIYAGGSAQAAQVLNGGVEQIGRGGRATGTVLLNGVQRVLYGGIASGTVVSSGLESILSGGKVSGMTLDAFGRLVDEGSVRIVESTTFFGALSGSGQVDETGGARLVLSGDGSGFSGQAVISGGTIELAGAGALGAGSVAFAARTVSETLQIDAADAPAQGGTFANRISGFSAANDVVDLRSIAFISGAMATASGGVLTLNDGGASYKFHLAGSIGSAFVVASDGHGGTLIDVAAGVVDPPGAVATATLIAPTAAAFVQAAAALSQSKAVFTPITSGGTSGFAALVGAAGSAGRG